MRTTVLTLILFIAAQLTLGQTYFYIDAIGVQPEEPTATDELFIELSGGLSSTGAYIVSSNASVQGNTVSITIVAADNGGATVIVPHTETIAIGTLPAGEYMIEINGTFAADLAPNAQHFFQVTAGDPCDGVDIDLVQWAPFSDTALVVHVSNNSTVLFDYPGFVLLDAGGDTLASETVNFFGIGEESHHTLRIHPDAVIPVGSSMVSLHLWTGFYSEQACSWELPVDLCPPAPCATLYPNLQNLGGALTLGDFSWTLLNEDLEVAGSGTFMLVEEEQYDIDTVCLPPGRYTMYCTYLQEPTGGQPYFGVMSHVWTSGPNAPLPVDLPAPLEFDFLPGCVNGTNDLPEIPTKAEIDITPDLDGIRVVRSDGTALGPVQVFDATGRAIGRTVTTGHSAYIDLRSVASGVVLVRAAGSVQRVVWTAQ